MSSPLPPPSAQTSKTRTYAACACADSQPREPYRRNISSALRRDAPCGRLRPSCTRIRSSAAGPARRPNASAARPSPSSSASSCSAWQSRVAQCTGDNPSLPSRAASAPCASSARVISRVISISAGSVSALGGSAAAHCRGVLPSGAGASTAARHASRSSVWSSDVRSNAHGWSSRRTVGRSARLTAESRNSPSRSANSAATCMCPLRSASSSGSAAIAGAPEPTASSSSDGTGSARRGLAPSRSAACAVWPGVQKQRPHLGGALGPGRMAPTAAPFRAA